MRVVVTGGAGFIGSHIAEAYVAAGHEVLVIDSLVTGFAHQVPKGARLVQADVRSEDAANALIQFAPDVVNHHAAQIDIRQSVLDPQSDADVNIGGTLRMLAATQRVGARRFIFASSGGALYGDDAGLPSDEQQPIRPISPYGVAKRAAELYLDAARATMGLDYVALRYANVYGPRQNFLGEAGVVAIFAERLRSGQDCTIFGDGLQTRDFVHVSDVVNANLAVLGTVPSGVYNIGTGRQTTVREIYDLVARAVGTSRPASMAPARAGELRRSSLSSQLARTSFAWVPTIRVADGVPATVRQALRG